MTGSLAQSSTEKDLFEVFGRQFRIYYDRNLRLWSASEYDRHGNLIRTTYADTRDFALIYIGMGFFPTAS